jgi:alpha-amylase
MGFNAIWISPITSNIDVEMIYGNGWHGYWQNHLYQLNENFGSEKDLIDFISEAHQLDIWILLDVVVRAAKRSLFFGLAWRTNQAN